MKRVVIFFTMLLFVLVVGYLEPVFFPDEKPKITIKKNNLSLHTAVPFEKFPNAGFAKFVGKSVGEFVQHFGEPLEKNPTGFDYELWFYQNKQVGQLEVSVVNNKIKAVKSFTDTKEIAPFYFGMTMSDVSEQMTVYSNFNFTYEHQDYALELLEEDMNYRPLIAFDNETFAILFFSHGTGKLIGITFLDKEYLLKVMPYQMIEGEPVLFESTPTVSSKKIETQMLATLNRVRKQEKLAFYQLTEDSQKKAQIILNLYTSNPSAILSPERLAIWQQSLESMTVDVPFTLTNDEYQKLLKLSKMGKKQKTGILTYPVYDTTFLIFSWFSDSLYYARLVNKENQTIGIACAQGSVLVLMQEDLKQDQTKDSE